MRLPTPLYESLPYLYLASGVLLLMLFSGNTPFMILGLALYLAGSSVWIMRSGARRQDRREHKVFLAQMHRQTDRLYFPEWFYEAQPFFYLLLSATCFYSLPNIGGIISGALFAFSSLMVFHSRIKHRQSDNPSLTSA